MYRVTIRFYEELNDFLKPARRKQDIQTFFPERRSVKSLIESFGVPHVEVDLILVNGESVDFSYIVSDGDRISVYPVFEALDIGSATRLRPAPLRDSRFAVDIHLRKLGRRLRLLGFDVYCCAKSDDADLAYIAATEDRVLLSRDRQLMMRNKVTRGLYIHNTDPVKQVKETLERLDLYSQLRPFTRCTECNGALAAFDPDANDATAAAALIPQGTRMRHHEYHRCRDCGRIYWKGSHYEKLRKWVDKTVSGQ